MGFPILPWFFGRGVQPSAPQATHTSPPSRPQITQEDIAPLFSEPIGPLSLAHIAFDLEHLMQEKTPELHQEIDNLRIQNGPLLHQLATKGWMDVKKDPAISRAMLQTFREDLVSTIGKISIRIATEDKGHAVAFGTKSVDSDHDRVLKGPLTHEEESKEWGLFQLAWRTLLGAHSDKMADVSTYTDHPGEALGTEKKLHLSQFKSAFSGLEIELSALQTYRSLSSNAEGLENYRDQLAADYLDLDLESRSKQGILHLNEAALFERNLQIGVLEAFAKINPLHAETMAHLLENGSAEELSQAYERLTKEFPGAMKDAAMLFKIPLVLKIGIEMDRIEGKIAQGLQTQNQAQIEEYTLELAAYGALRNALYDDSYLTESAYNVICLRGQIPDQKKEKAASSLRAIYYHPSPLAVPHLHITEVESVPSSMHELLVSQQENLGKFFSHFDADIKAGSTREQALIKHSKYLQRISDANVGLIKALTEHGILVEPSLQDILEDAEPSLQGAAVILEERIGDLEKIKRRKFLPFDFAVEHLAKELSPADAVDLTPWLYDQLHHHRNAQTLSKEDLVLPEDLFHMAIANIGTFYPLNAKSLIILRSLSGLSIDNELVREGLLHDGANIAEQEALHESLFREAEAIYRPDKAEIDSLISSILKTSRKLEAKIYNSDLSLAPTQIEKLKLSTLLSTLME